MSKITRALEKAARDRLESHRARPTVTSAPVETIVAATNFNRIAEAGPVKINPHIVAISDANSPIAEQYRVLRTNLQSLRMGSGPKVILVTSALHGEGKSVTAVNLAITLARQERRKVILVDCDLRKSSVHAWLGLGIAARGLGATLSGSGILDGTMVRLESPQLTVLPAGPMPDDPAELLSSVNMKRLLATLKSRFDIAILDAPPVLPVADAGILAAQADGVILVVRSGKTPRRALHHAYERLKQARAKVIGSVLTHAEHHMPGYEKYYYEYHYSSKKPHPVRDMKSPECAPGEMKESGAAQKVGSRA